MHIINRICGERVAQLTANVLSQPFSRRIIDGQLHHVGSWENIAFLAKTHLPLVGQFFQFEMRIKHGQQKTVVESLANLPGQLFDNGEIEDQLILVQCAIHLDQHPVVMPMQPLALSTKRNEVSCAKLEIATFYFYLARNESFCQSGSPASP